MPAPGAGGVQASLTGMVRGMDRLLEELPVPLPCLHQFRTCVAQRSGCFRPVADFFRQIGA